MARDGKENKTDSLTHDHYNAFSWDGCAESDDGCDSCDDGCAESDDGCDGCDDGCAEGDDRGKWLKLLHSPNVNNQHVNNQNSQIEKRC